MSSVIVELSVEERDAVVDMMLLSEHHSRFVRPMSEIEREALAKLRDAEPKEKR